MDFGLKAGKVTVLRLGKDKDGYRMFIYKGEALDEPQKFYGTSVTVRPEMVMQQHMLKTSLKMVGNHILLLLMAIS